jgi:hypothetical protein
MRALNAANGRKAKLGLFLEKLDLARRSQWQKLLSLQAEQLRRLACLIETKRAAPGPGPVLRALAQHRNARERENPEGRF